MPIRSQLASPPTGITDRLQRAVGEPGAGRALIRASGGYAAPQLDSQDSPPHAEPPGAAVTLPPASSTFVHRGRSETMDGL